jgi:hypothetical protein
LLLQNTAITDDAMGHFEAWSELEWVDLKGTQVSDAAADRLRAKYPKCEIETHWTRGCSRCRRPFPTRNMDAAICPTCTASAQYSPR